MRWKKPENLKLEAIYLYDIPYSMKKYLLSLFVLFTVCSAEAQFDYSGDQDDIPVTGVQYGVVGVGHMSTIYNYDDFNADHRLDPNFSNFSYGFGAQRIRWYSPWFGVGPELLYWVDGAAYTGVDTIGGTPWNLDGSSQFQTIKLPVLFHWKSYNRYYHERRMRLNLFFGPYVSAVIGASDEWELSVPDTDPVVKQSFSVTDRNVDWNGGLGTLDASTYKPFDWGFVMGAGGEFRLWKRTVVALGIRMDVGAQDIENKGTLQFTAQGSGQATDFDYWNILYSKFVNEAPNIITNRPGSRNLSAGGYLSVRKYIGKK